MGDTRKHRGPHPADRELFAEPRLEDLRRAAHDLAWLLTREYAVPSAVKLVGDRYRLTARQRLAVARSACSDQSLARRRQTLQPPEQLAGEMLLIDGFNLLTTIEAALSGGVVLKGRDGCYRDLASMHGSYRKVAETAAAIERIGAVTAGWRAAGCTWYLDRPVSNSGRLAQSLRESAVERGWNWEVELPFDPDAVLAEAAGIVISSDSGILERCDRWANLAADMLAEIPEAWVVVFDL